MTWKPIFTLTAALAAAPAVLAQSRTPLAPGAAAQAVNRQLASYAKVMRSLEIAIFADTLQWQVREGAKLDGGLPVFAADSQPGRRVAPRRMAKPGAEPDATEEALESLLDIFQSGARARPHELLGLPPAHLATAYMFYAMRHYMVLRGLDDVSAELAREVYACYRTLDLSAPEAGFLKDPKELQFHYESLLIAALWLDCRWQMARFIGDPHTQEGLQRRAGKGLAWLFGKDLEQELRQMDDIDGRTRGRSAEAGMRTALRVMPPWRAWPQFEGWVNEDLEYSLTISTSPDTRGTVRVAVRVETNGDGALTIGASLGARKLDAVVPFKRLTGLPDLAGLPWAQTELGKLVAGLLFRREAGLASHDLEPGQGWSARRGAEAMETVVTAPCPGRQESGGKFVTVTARQNATDPGVRMIYCVARAPLPLSVALDAPGAGAVLSLVRRAPHPPAGQD